MTEVSHQIVADLLRARTGQQLTEGRRWRISTALSSLFREHGISNVDQLVCMLAMPGAETLTRDVVEALLNNETYFFRDRPMFEQLARKVLPELAERRASGRRLRIWSAGCSTGQEAYTLAMLFADQPDRWRDWSIEIVGSDVSGRAIEAAKRACYSQFEIQRGLGVGQMLTWFRETEQGWQPHPRLRGMVRFEQRNILDPATRAGRFDIVLCRNVLLYFDSATRALAFERLDQALAEGGWLMLGAGETVVGRTGVFDPIEGNQGLFQRRIECGGRQAFAAADGKSPFNASLAARR
jgi:chemotaxis protein methyltransferase CheR